PPNPRAPKSATQPPCVFGLLAVAWLARRAASRRAAPPRRAGLRCGGGAAVTGEGRGAARFARQVSPNGGASATAAAAAASAASRPAAESGRGALLPPAVLRSWVGRASESHDFVVHVNCAPPERVPVIVRLCVSACACGCVVLRDGAQLDARGDGDGCHRGDGVWCGCWCSGCITFKPNLCLRTSHWMAAISLAVFRIFPAVSDGTCWRLDATGKAQEDVGVTSVAKAIYRRRCSESSEENFTWLVLMAEKAGKFQWSYPTVKE
ncbi:Protein of unknown function, partial [Gryllus bimaculatus]